MTENYALMAKIAQWALGRDTGSSSKFLAACIIGLPDSAEIARPYDWDDFGRIYRLTKNISIEDTVRGLQIASIHEPLWGIIAGNWAELCQKYEHDLSTGEDTLNEFMTKIGL